MELSLHSVNASRQWLKLETHIYTKTLFMELGFRIKLCPLIHHCCQGYVPKIVCLLEMIKRLKL